MSDNKEFTLQEWASTKPEVYVLSEEANNEIAAAAKAFSAVCAKHQAPCVAAWQGRQTEDGSFSCGVEAELVTMDRMGPAILASSLLPVEEDPMGMISTIMGAFSQRMNN